MKEITTVERMHLSAETTITMAHNNENRKLEFRSLTVFNNVNNIRGAPTRKYDAVTINGFEKT